MGLDRMWDEVQRSVNAPDRFEKHLDLLLDGIEADLARRAQSTSENRAATQEASPGH